ENANELSLFCYVTAVEPPEVAASAAEPPEVSVVSTYELLSCPEPATEADCELPVCLVATNNYDLEL
ncbi:hypothetical protein M9458_028687, partial [Cirrhinus mrigala]